MFVPAVSKGIGKARGNSLRIVQVCTGFPPDREGGVENVVRSLSTELRRRGNEVYVVTRLWKHPLNDKFVIQLRTPRGEAAGYAVWGLRSINTIRKLKPNIVHCHGLEGAVVCNLLRGSGIATVFHLHNSLSREPGFYGRLTHKVGLRILKGACQGATVVVCPTNIVKSDVLAHLPSLDENRIAVVPNMVEGLSSWPAERLQPLRESLGVSGRKVILYFGKVKRSKGIEDLCKAYELLNDKEGVALIIGGAPTWTENFFNQLKHDYPTVVFTGFVADPSPYYQLADVFCIYTDSFEGGETFAISLAEAMSFGIPVVCSDNPIYREVTQDSAVFVRPRSPLELSKALKSVLASSEYRNRYSDLWKRIVQERYTSVSVVSELEAIYREHSMLKARMG